MAGRHGRRRPRHRRLSHPGDGGPATFPERADAARRQQVGLAQGCSNRWLNTPLVREQFGVRIARSGDPRTAVPAPRCRSRRPWASAAAAAEEDRPRGNDTAATQFTLLARAESADAQAARPPRHRGVRWIGLTWEHDAHLLPASATGARRHPARLRDAAAGRTPGPVALGSALMTLSADLSGMVAAVTGVEWHRCALLLV